MDYQWFFAEKNGTQSGPHTLADLRDRLANRAIDMTTQVWREGLANWVPLGSVANELGLATAGPPMPPPLAGGSMPPPPSSAQPVNPYADARARSDAAFANNLVNDSTVLRAFVGPNFERYQQQWAMLDRTQGKIAWNWSAFLLGAFWLAYRKMYAYCAAMLGAVVVLSVLEAALEVPTGVSNGINFGFAVAIGMLGNHLYRVHAQKKLSELPRHLSREETVTAASHAGGTSVGAAIGVAVAFFMLVFIAVAAAM